MPTFDDFRNRFPSLKDASDEEIIEKASKVFKLPVGQVMDAFGYQLNEPGIGADIKRGTGQLVESIGSTLRDIGAPDVGKSVERYGRDVAFKNPSEINTFSEALQSPGTTAREALGEVTPQIASSTATGVAGGAIGRGIGSVAGTPFGPGGVVAGNVIGGYLGFKAGQFLGNLAQEYGGIRTEQREAGIEDKTRALTAATVAAGLDTGFGIEGAIGKVAKGGLNILSREAGKSLTGHVVKQGAIGFGTESLTEGGQTALERWGASKDLLNAEAGNEYGLSMLKGGIGGGTIRGGMSALAGQHKAEDKDTTGVEHGNELSQAFEHKDATQPDISSFVPTKATDPAARLAELDAITNGTKGREITTPDGEIIRVPGTDPRLFTKQEREEYAALKQQLAAPAAAPAMAGGQSEVAVASQQAQQANAQAAQAQQQNQAAQQAVEQFGITSPDTPAVGNFFGQKIFGPNIPAVAHAVANFTTQMQPQQLQLAQAIVKANNETGGQLVKFQFNANDVAASVQKGFKAVEKVATQLQIAHVQSVDEAAAILNDQSEQVHGDKLDQLNSIFQALTGRNTNGYEADQLSKLAKGAKNGKLQLQTTTGLGTVSVEGGTREAANGGAGPVRPTEIQPLGTTGLGEGSLGLQTGQLPASGVRTGTAADTSVRVGQPTSQPQVSEATNGQATQVSAENGARGGQANESRETGKPNVVETVSTGNGGPRVYRTPTEYYNSDMMHIRPERRSAILSLLFGAVLRTSSKVATADKRVSIIEMTLMEGMTSKQIAKELGLSEDAVEKQRERMGLREAADGTMEIALDTDEGKAFLNKLVSSATDFRSAEFPDGIGPMELAGLYAAKDLYFEDGEVTHVGEAVEEEQEGRTGAKLAEELYNTDTGETRTMGTIGSIGGSQGAVDEFGGTAEERIYAKIGKLNAMLDIAKEAGDTAGVANVEKQLQTEWAKFGKLQSKRTGVGEIEVAEPEAEKDLTGKPLFEEEENAVQEPSPKKVPVRKRTGGGEAVGKGNAEERKAAPESETKVEVKPKQEVAVLTPAEKWEAIAADYPLVPPYESLTEAERARWGDLANRTEVDVTDIARVVGTTKAAQQQQIENDRTIDGDGLIRVLTPEQTQLLAAPVAKLTEGQTARLERHYGFKRDTQEFLTKLHDDIALYAAKGAAAVNAAIRDIVKAVYTAVLATAVVFNPTYMNKAEAYAISVPQEFSVTREVRATAPEAAASKMSAAAKEAYATLVPALKAELKAKNKLLIMADKPSGRIFVFTPDGELVMEKKSLFGLAKGDFYKGNNDLPANRVTPAGLHNIVMVDAAKGGAAAKTAGEYDFGKVFGIVDKNPGVLTIMHSVWLHESDAAKRAAALKSESAADSRYSFGCINVDKATYKNLIDNHGEQMDGAKLFVVPDEQSRVQDFVSGAVAQNKTGEDKLVRQAVTPVTETTTGVRQTATQTAATERTVVGKEEEVKLASKSAPSQFMAFDDLESNIGGMDLVREQLEEAGIGHAIDLVSDWELVNDSSKNAEHGSLRTVQGRYVGTLNIAKLDDANYAAEVARHEIAHAIDMGPHGGIYSAQPEMGVSVVNGNINAEGPVAKELFNLYKTDTKWGDFLSYPFDSTKFPELNNRTKVQLELFAQAFSIYTTPEGRAIMETQAPVTAAYFKEVIQDVKSTKPLQIQKAEIAANRAAILNARRQSKGDRGPSKLLGFDERVDELLASRSQKSDLNKPAGPFAKAGQVLDDLLTRPGEAVRKLKLGFLTLDQLAELDKSQGQVVRTYANIMTAMQMASKDIVDRAAQIDRQWAKLSPKESADLSQVMRDATRMQFDPDTPSGPQAEFNDDQSALRDAFIKLDPRARDIYRKVRQHYQDLFDQRKAILEDSAAKLGGKAQKEIEAMYSKLKGPYFPLARSGDYYAVGMSPRVAELTAKKEDEGLDNAETVELAALRKQKDQYQTSSFRTLREAKQAAERFQQEMGHGSFNEIRETIHGRLSSEPNFAKLEEYITSQLGGETRAEVSSMLSQMMFDMLPEHHALKRQMKREGIHGENEDMRQVFAQTSISQAHYISRLQYGEMINKALQGVAKQGRHDYNMRTIENELILRTKLSMDNQQSALVDSLVNVSYFAHLGLSPAFLLTNMTQVPMITAPWLGARHGVGATKRAMGIALTDAAKIIKTTYENGDWRSELDWNSVFAKGSNEDRMFRTLLDRNVLDITMEHDLAAIASAQRGLFDDKISAATKGKMGGLADVVQLINTPVRVTELANRTVTALSAYNLKMEALKTSPLSAEEKHNVAVDYAARAVSETQFNYSEMNAPRHMRQVLGSKPIAKLVFQFRKYQQGLLYLVTKNIADALPNSNATKAERRIARRTIAGLYITTGVMAGTTGMPLMGTVGVAGIANLLMNAFGDDDEPWDFDTEYRNFLADWLGHDMGLLVAKGVPAYLGADLSQRVGMAEVANPLPFVQRGNTGASTIANTMYAAGGAPIGMFGSLYDGVVDLANGDGLKGAEKIIPVKAMKDALRAYRYSDEGMTDKRGNVILPPEKFDSMDIAMRGMGFTPTKEAEYYEANAALQSAKTAATDVRTQLLRRYAEARMKDEDTDAIEEKIDAFNERHPEQGVRIDVSSKLKAVQARRRMAAERTESGVRIGKYEKPFADEARFATEEEE